MGMLRPSRSVNGCVPRRAPRAHRACTEHRSAERRAERRTILCLVVPPCWLLQFQSAAQRLEACRNRSSGEDCQYAGEYSSVNHGSCVEVGPVNLTAVVCVAEDAGEGAAGGGGGGQGGGGSSRSNADPLCAKGLLNSQTGACCPRYCGDCSEDLSAGASNVLAPDEAIDFTLRAQACSVALVLRLGPSCENSESPCVLLKTPSQGNAGSVFLTPSGNTGGVSGRSSSPQGATPARAPESKSFGGIGDAAMVALVIGISSLCVCCLCCNYLGKLMRADLSNQGDHVGGSRQAGAPRQPRLSAKALRALEASNPSLAAGVGLADDDDWTPRPGDYGESDGLRASTDWRDARAQGEMALADEGMVLDPGTLFIHDIDGDLPTPRARKAMARDMLARKELEREQDHLTADAAAVPPEAPKERRKKRRKKGQTHDTAQEAQPRGRKPRRNRLGNLLGLASNGAPPELSDPSGFLWEAPAEPAREHTEGTVAPSEPFSLLVEPSAVVLGAPLGPSSPDLPKAMPAVPAVPTSPSSPLLLAQGAPKSSTWSSKSGDRDVAWHMKWDALQEDLAVALDGELDDVGGDGPSFVVPGSTSDAPR